MRAILSHGPWPVPPARDPSNRVSGKPEAIELGERLFFDTRLSGTEAGFPAPRCHVPDRSWTDNRKRGAAVAEMDRNTPTLMNVRLESLVRLGRRRRQPVVAEHTARSSIRASWERARGRSPSSCAATSSSRAAIARRSGRRRRRPTTKACWWTSPRRSPRSRKRSQARALRSTSSATRSPAATGSAAARYPVAAQRGLKIFIGQGACSTCHTGPNFTNGEFHDTGLPFFAAPGRVDPGRHEGIKQLRESRYNLLGPYNDDPARATATGTRHVTLEHRNFGEFKVPSLRNASFTAPYGTTVSSPPSRTSCATTPS